MESPIVVDKPPEYHSSKKTQEHDKGFPFDEEGEDGAWSDLASRHPDIAARLRARPPAWGRKRRGDAHNPDQYDDVSGGWGDNFNRFPFGDIPAEFRDHFPSHWGDRFGSQERTPQEAEGRSPQRNQQFAESSSRQPPPSQAQAQPTPKPQPQKSQTIATQTEEFPLGETAENTTATETETNPSTGLAQHGLRNTVDLGQKSPADPVLLDGDSSYNQRSMSAPPDSRVPNQNNMGNIAGGGPQPTQPQQQDQHSNTEPLGHGNVRHIPIFVEGRDAPVINKNSDQAGSFGETFQPPPPQPEREQFFAEREVPHNFHQPPHFGRTFGTPFSKGFQRQGAQPFSQQKGFPQSPFAHGGQQGVPQQSQARSNSPKPTHTQHTQATPPQPQAAPQPSQAPPPQPQAPPANDPISKILNIQKDVLELMTEVENFTGAKQDKRYIYLDEMLTRNLIKLDDIETDGKENIRMARKEAIKCIQKCISVLEAKAEENTKLRNKEDIEMKESIKPEVNGETENGISADETKEAELSAETQEQTEDQSTESPKKKIGAKKGVKKREKSKDKGDTKQEENSAAVDEKEGKPVQVTE